MGELTPSDEQSVEQEERQRTNQRIENLRQKGFSEQQIREALYFGEEMANFFQQLNSQDPKKRAEAADTLKNLLDPIINKNNLNISPNTPVEEMPHVRLTEAIADCIEAFDPEKADLQTFTTLAKGPQPPTTLPPQPIPNEVQAHVNAFNVGASG